MTNIVEPINSYRVEEKDGFQIQFFDKKRQITNEDLETIDVLDANGNPIYDLYVEIYNKNDPYSILCKRVDTNLKTFNLPNSVKKHFKYTDVYVKAFEIYKKRKEKLSNEKQEILEIEKLKAELAELRLKNQTQDEQITKVLENKKSENKKTEKNKELTNNLE